MEFVDTLLSLMFLLVLCNICFKSVIAREINSGLYSDDVLTFIPHKNLQNIREKRSIQTLEKRESKRAAENGTSSEIENKLKTTIIRFSDKTHHQAIVSWSGEGSCVVHLLTRELAHGLYTEQSSFYRSDDCFSSFKRVYFSEDIVIHSIYKSPVNYKMLILTDLDNKLLLRSRDEGLSWEESRLTFEPNRLIMHPTLQNWVLALSELEFRVYVSSDFGESWKLLKEEVTHVQWGFPGVDANNLTVHMEVSDLIETKYFSCTVPTCTDNTLDKTIGNINFHSLHVQGEFILVSQKAGQGKELLVSHQRKPFRKAEFPLNVHPKNFFVIETKDNQVFLVADHLENVVVLYLSDASGQYYIPCLERVVSEISDYGIFVVDVYEVEGIRGRYLANVEQTVHDKSYYQTRITYDKGATWHPIPAPPGEEHLCVGQTDCGLHLHMSFSYVNFIIPKPLSDVNAPGLIYAHGNVGKGLEFDNYSLYVSSDGGLTWRKTSLQGAFRVNILDRGGAIVAVEDKLDEKANELFFSLDEGWTWEKKVFMDTPIIVDGIINKPGLQSLLASIVGRVDAQGDWVMVKLDFSEMLTRQCSLLDDYIDWKPGAGIANNNCILGESVTIEKRKQDSICFNGENFERRPKTRAKCLCTSHDFECDYGYQHDPKGQCVVSSWYNHSSTSRHDCVEGQMYNRSSGYRKMASSSCVGGEETKGIYQPIPTLCPIVPPGGLRLTTSSSAVAVGSKMDFLLSQAYGSTTGTTYSWNFGDGSPVTRKSGLKEAATMSHVYSIPGHYNVTVTASNGNGTSVCTYMVSVESIIKGLIIIPTRGGIKNRETQFNVSLIGSFHQTDFGYVHYAWKFGDEVGSMHPFLTWGTTVSHVYNRTGTFTVTVQAINAVSSYKSIYTLRVFDAISIVRLAFTKNIDHFSDSSFQWRFLTSKIIANTLAEVLYIQDDRLVVSIPPTSPIVADVSILPRNSSGLTIEQVLSELQKKVSSRQIQFELDVDDNPIGIEGITVLEGPPNQHTNNNASAVSSSSTIRPPKGQDVPVYVYIVIPLIFITFVGVLSAVMVVRRCKKKSKDRTYAMITNRNYREDDDNMLGCESEDDEFTGGGENIFEYHDNDNNIVYNTGNPRMVLVQSVPRRHSDSLGADVELHLDLEC